MSVTSFCPLPFTYLSFGILACFLKHIQYIVLHFFQSLSLCENYLGMSKLFFVCSSFVCLQLLLSLSLPIGHCSSQKQVALNKHPSTLSASNMNSHLSTWLLLSTVLAFCHCYTVQDLLPRQQDIPNGGKIWVVLVAGSNGYFNYRHQGKYIHNF